MSTSVFCPTCANLLLVEECTGGSGLRFCCATCPYVYNVDKTITHVVPTQSKEVDDVLGGEEAWRNVDATAAVCPKCSHNKAFFMQVQIRSGDEPMTTFYKARAPRRPRHVSAGANTPPSLHRAVSSVGLLEQVLCSSAESRMAQCVACKHQWREG